MKKIMILIAVCAFVSVTTSAFAAVVTYSNINNTVVGTTIGLVTFAPSPDVTLMADTSTVGYVVSAKHTGGDVIYSSDHANPGIVETTGTTESAKGAVLSALVVTTIPTN